MTTRDEFEKWHREHNGTSLMKHSDGQYVYAESEWRSYLAGRESMREEAMAVVNNHTWGRLCSPMVDAIRAIPLETK